MESASACASASEPPAKEPKLPKSDWWITHAAVDARSNIQPSSAASSGRMLAADRVRVGSEESFVKFPGLRDLAFRQLDIVIRNCPAGLPEPPPGRLLEVGQTYGRHQARVDVADTLLPKGELFQTHLCRVILGYEKLRLQGLWRRPLPCSASAARLCY